MEPITVYRVEFETGEGLHRARNDEGRYVLDSHSCRNKILERHSDRSVFPAPNLDRTLWRISDIKYYHFAYNNLATLQLALLPHEVKECVDLGFKILELTVTDYIQSPHQTIFKKSSIINRLDITKQFL